MSGKRGGEGRLTKESSEWSTNNFRAVDHGDSSSSGSVARREEGVVDVGVLESFDLLGSARGASAKSSKKNRGRPQRTMARGVQGRIDLRVPG
jgi:hypothetical protein